VKTYRLTYLRIVEESYDVDAESVNEAEAKHDAKKSQLVHTELLSCRRIATEHILTDGKPS
jgi:hypothetical protein